MPSMRAASRGRRARGRLGASTLEEHGLLVIIRLGSPDRGIASPATSRSSTNSGRTTAAGALLTAYRMDLIHKPAGCRLTISDTTGIYRAVRISSRSIGSGLLKKSDPLLTADRGGCG